MSQFGTGDLAGVIVQRDREFVGFAEGVVRSWDPSTFSHTINVRGTDLHDLDVAAGAEALTIVPGDTVLLTKWKPRSRKGSATYRVGSGARIIRPGTGAAAQTIAFLQTSLGSAISAGAFAARIDGDAVFTLDNLGQTSDWVDLGTPGPAVADVDVSETGLALVLHGCEVGLTTSSSNLSARGSMSFEVSGATALPPGQDAVRIAQLGNTLGLPGDVSVSPNANVMTASWVPLNEGQHTFTAKYDGVTSAAGNWITFQRRFIIVVSF